jgi:hypothetical protein
MIDIPRIIRELESAIGAAAKDIHTACAHLNDPSYAGSKLGSAERHARDAEDALAKLKRELKDSGQL